MTPRIPARKTPLLEALIYRVLVRPAIRRAFDRVLLHEATPFAPSPLPTLIYSNHPSWWDGYMAFVLSDEVWRTQGYLMMEEPQLRRYRFFQYCGVFSVDRHDAREGLRSVTYAADLLAKQPKRTVFIFPQGTITPNDRRPLVTYGGAAQIAKRAAPVRCIPMALRFEFAGQQRPEALIRLGEPHVVDQTTNVKALHTDMDERLIHEMDELRSDTISGVTETYRTILRGRQSINVWFDGVLALFRRSG